MNTTGITKKGRFQLADRVFNIILIITLCVAAVLLALMIYRSFPSSSTQIVCVQASPGSSVVSPGISPLPQNPPQTPVASQYLSGQSVSQTSLDPATLQIAERVRDATAFLDTTVKLVGFLVSLLSILVGLSLWKSTEFAISLLNDYFVQFKQKDLAKTLDDACKQVTNLNKEGFSVIATGVQTLLVGLDDKISDAYCNVLRSTGANEELVEVVAKTQKRQLNEMSMVTLYLFASLSRDHKVVDDACLSLWSMVHDKKPCVLSRADAIKSQMKGLVDNWAPGTQTRNNIQAVIDEIDRQ